MDLVELGALGELVGGLAVLATLIYLAKQIRQSNTLVRAQAHQEASRRSSELLVALSEPDQIGLLSWMNPGYEALPDADKIRAGLRFLAFVNYYETVFYARERGEVDDDLWESRVARMKWTFTDLNPELWQQRKAGFGKRFRDFVETEIIPHPERYF